MAHEEEKFNDADLQSAYSREERARKDAGIDDRDTYFLNTLRYLKDALKTASTPRFNSDMRLVEAKVVNSTLETLESSMPAAIQYSKQIKEQREEILRKAQRSANAHLASANNHAARITEDAEREAEEIVRQAQKEAASIIEEAKNQRDALLEQHSITEEARTQAETIVQNAKAEANRTKNDVMHYCNTMLRDLEDSYSEFADHAKETRNKLLQQYQAKEKKQA